MKAVLDASAAVTVALDAARAPELARIVSEAEWVLAPTLFVAEVTNAFWKYHAFQSLAVDVCEQGIARCLSLPDAYADDRELQAEAFGLACAARRPVYDMLYLVLARRHNAILISADRTLLNVAARHGVRVG